MENLEDGKNGIEVQGAIEYRDTGHVALGGHGLSRRPCKDATALQDQQLTEMYRTSRGGAVQTHLQGWSLGVGLIGGLGVMYPCSAPPGVAQR